MPKRIHPLRRLAERQKRGEVAALVTDTEARIRQTYLEARTHAGGVLADFARAYEAERARLQALHADEEEAEDERARDDVRVPLSWLKLSGWEGRVRHALEHASHTAIGQSRTIITHGVKAAHARGAENARQLLVEAMRPATQRGLSWRPK